MLIFVLFLVILCAYLVSHKLYDSILNPISIFIGVNIISIILSIIQDFDFVYNFTSIFAILLMFSAFIFGITLGVNKGYKPSVIHLSIYNRKIFIRVIASVSIIYDISLYFYLKNLFSTFTIFDFISELNQINAYVQSDQYESSWYNYLIPLGFPLTFFCGSYLIYCKKNIFVILQTVLSALYTFSPRRDTLFILILSILFFILFHYQNIKRGKDISKQIIAYSFIFGFIIIGIMSYTQSLMNKESAETIMIQTMKLPSALTTPYQYISLNYPYLQYQDLSFSDFPEYPFMASLRIGYILVNRLLGTNIDTVTDFELEFLNIANKTSTNTTPLLYYSYLDLGIFFFIDFIILGYISQKAYYSSRSGDISKRIIAAMWYTLLALSFRGYLMIFLIFILSMFYTFLLGKLLKLRK